MRLCLTLLSAALTAMAADRVPFGLTLDQKVIEAWASPAEPGLPRVVWIGGLDGKANDELQKEFQAWDRNRSRKRIELWAIPNANPAGEKLVFPPTGDAYRENATANALWRSLATLAPDLVLISGPDSGLAAVLSSQRVATVGAIPARVVTGSLRKAMGNDIPKSPARTEIEARQVRTPREVALQMAKVYGNELQQVAYIPAFAVWGRLRLGELAHAEALAAPYINGQKNSLDKATSSHLSGHLIFAELAEKTGNRAYVDRVRAAADMGFSPSGEMLESMPMHSKMSDSVFMGCPILVKAGKLTGERKYFDMAHKHYRFMKAMDLRPDGLWRHSPADEAAWGRGNAFAILGLALSLSDLPKDHPAYDEMLRDYRSLVAALAKQQDSTGMFRQVIDFPGAYRELSSTSIIGAMIHRGVKRGWLDEKTHAPLVQKAWRAVSARTSPRGELIDVCEGTGAMKSLTDYLRRKALLGTDPRGGAMLLLFSTELAGL
ncbi:MAG: glycoside hydrolase family 88 protein [Bryobacterales bacterium]|nr:glycoside hydrolase family 88 protein [Bryobacterales bacterium]